MRFDMAVSTASVSCPSTGCGAGDCCITPRATCGDPAADRSNAVFDCSLAIMYIDPNPNDVYCLKIGCSFGECCTADTAPRPPAPAPTPSGAGRVAMKIAVTSAVVVVAAAL